MVKKSNRKFQKVMLALAMLAVVSSGWGVPGIGSAESALMGKVAPQMMVNPAKAKSKNSKVWIPTRGGKKYHSRASCSNMKGPKRVTLAKAKKLGFTACKKCKPPKKALLSNVA